MSVDLNVTDQYAMLIGLTIPRNGEPLSEQEIQSLEELRGDISMNPKLLPLDRGLLLDSIYDILDGAKR